MNWTHFSLLLDWKRFRTWWIAGCKWIEENKWRCTECGFSASIASLLGLAPAERRDLLLTHRFIGLFKKNIHKWCLVVIEPFKDSKQIWTWEELFYIKILFCFIFVKPCDILFSSFFLMWRSQSFLPFCNLIIEMLFMGIRNLYPCESIIKWMTELH